MNKLLIALVFALGAWGCQSPAPSLSGTPAGWLNANKVEFVENTIESTVFNGETAIETSIFEIRDVPKNGGPASTARGRSMVVYIKYPQSPTGWVSLREMTQEAPEK